MVATDTEISLFQKVDETEYFGYNDELKKMRLADLTEHADPGDKIINNPMQTISPFRLVTLVVLPEWPTEPIMRGKAFQA